MPSVLSTLAESDDFDFDVVIYVGYGAGHVMHNSNCALDLARNPTHAKTSSWVQILATGYGMLTKTRRCCF